MVRTVRNSTVVRLFEVPISCERVADSGVFWLGEVVIDGVIKALTLPLVVYISVMLSEPRTLPVNVEFDLLLQVPTRSEKSCACACITAAASSSAALNDTMLPLFLHLFKRVFVVGLSGCADRRGRGQRGGVEC